MTTKKKATRKTPEQKLFTASNRPHGGNDLFAHSVAALTVLGLLVPEGKRKAREPKAIKIVMGDSALSHHTVKTGNFGRDSDGKVILTKSGIEAFGGRTGILGQEQRTDQKADPKIVKAMIDALRKGGSVTGHKGAVIRFDAQKSVPA